MENSNQRQAMIQTQQIPHILEKIDALVTAYAHICGLEQYIYLWERKIAGHINAMRMCVINWEQIFAVSIVDTNEIYEYVTEHHPLYVQFCDIRLILITEPRKFTAEHMHALNEIWSQIKLLEKDGSIKEHVQKTIDDAVKNIKQKTTTQAPEEDENKLSVAELYDEIKKLNAIEAMEEKIPPVINPSLYKKLTDYIKHT